MSLLFDIYTIKTYHVELSFVHDNATGQNGRRDRFDGLAAVIRIFYKGQYKKI